MSPQTEKIAYLVVSHGGLWRMGETYTPVPWADFKSAVSTNLMVLPVQKSTLRCPMTNALLYNGFKLRTLFVSPDAADRDVFYGVNFEFSRHPVKSLLRAMRDFHQQPCTGRAFEIAIRRRSGSCSTPDSATGRPVGTR
jgi:hypothetical protein